MVDICIIMYWISAMIHLAVIIYHCKDAAFLPFSLQQQQQQLVGDIDGSMGMSWKPVMMRIWETLFYNDRPVVSVPRGTHQCRRHVTIIKMMARRQHVNNTSWRWAVPLSPLLNELQTKAVISTCRPQHPASTSDHRQGQRTPSEQLPRIVWGPTPSLVLIAQVVYILYAGFIQHIGVPKPIAISQFRFQQINRK